MVVTYRILIIAYHTVLSKRSQVHMIQVRAHIVGTVKDLPIMVQCTYDKDTYCVPGPC